MIVTGPFFYATRLVERGPIVGLKLWTEIAADPLTGELLDRSPIWRAERNGVEIDFLHAIIEMDGLSGLPVVMGDKITEADYRYHTDLARHCVAYDHMAPEAAPRSPIDLNTMKPLF